MRQYWLKRGANAPIEGPFEAADLKRGVAAGAITEASTISVDKVKWVPAAKVKGLLPAPSVTPLPVEALGSQAATGQVVPSTARQETKACPYCGEQILAVAIKCKQCGERLGPTQVSYAGPIEHGVCGTCGQNLAGGLPYNFYERLQICKRCRNSIINRRVGAYILDVLAVYLVMFVFGFMWGILQGVAGPSQRELAQGANLLGCCGWLFFVAYFLIKDGVIEGRSIGKLTCGIRVIDMGSGEPADVAASAKRNLPLLIPFVPLIAAFQLYGGKRWGDGWANTMVVRNSWARFD